MVHLLYIADISDFDEECQKFINRQVDISERSNSEYRIVNDKVISLKKLEFDYSNLCVVVCNYIIVLELITKHLFDPQIDNIETYSNRDSVKNKVDVIEQLLFIVEDTIFFKSEELQEHPLIIRKIIMRLFKDQKQNLILGCME